MDTFYNTINGYDPNLKDTINELTLEALNDTDLEFYINYVHKDLYSILSTYYPSLDLNMQAVFELHPMYFKYIKYILSDKTHINNISQNIKDYFEKNPEKIGQINIFIQEDGLKFGLEPAASVSSLYCDGKKYGFHNLDSLRQQNIYEKVFKIYITYVYNTILKMIKGDTQMSEQKLGYIPTITIKLNGKNA